MERHIGLWRKEYENNKPTVAELIIDGNHRILENLNNPFLSFKCYVLADETILDYLEPNSRKFAEFIYYLNQLMQN